uniref:Uncharacterized protein n=1 Tax=Setaria italica TaxID=4555 RepID=K3YKT7_SETIT
MASFPFPIKPLDGAGGYLRWKESVLLGLHMVDVAHVLSDDPPAPARAGGDGDGAQAAKKWARDDALCRGHILEALSNRLLPVYVRHATGRALWQAVARTYEPHASSLELRPSWRLERVARAEALVIAGFPWDPDSMLARKVRAKLPCAGDETSMDGVWRSAQDMETLDNYTQ